MDGVWCDSWSKTLTFERSYENHGGILEYVNPFGDVRDVVKRVKDASWLMARMNSPGYGQKISEEWTVFGSIRKLIVREVPWHTGGTTNVAYDLEAGYGFVLDHERACSEADEHANNCQVWTESMGRKKIPILGRASPFPQGNQRNVRIMCMRSCLARRCEHAQATKTLRNQFFFPDNAGGRHGSVL